jgi:hypothetical protein
MDMMAAEWIKTYLKQYRLAQYVNEQLKCYKSKQQYNLLCRRYGTPSILKDPLRVKNLGKEMWAGLMDAHPYIEERPKVLFVGTDWEQDHLGIIQGLSKVADVTLFESAPERYGQRWPTSNGDVEAVRQHNVQRLRQYLKTSEGQSSIQIIIGQMWGISMHWRGLAEAREKGITVVNIAMDDRHAFVGQKIADGTYGGTLGLTPYLSLACTDAPECVQWYEAEGCKAVYLPEASDPDLFRPLPGPKLFDVCFVGANYGIRAKIVAALERAGVRVQVYGKGWPNGRLPTDQVPELFARSRIVLGCGTIGYCEDFLALKMRDFDGPMSGSLYMTHDNPDLESLYRIGEEIVTFQNIPEMVSKVKHFLNNKEERERLAQRGRERSAREHTWVQRFHFIIKTLQQTYN